MNHKQRMELFNKLNTLNDTLVDALDQKISIINREVLIRQEIIEINKKLMEDEQ